MSLSPLFIYDKYANNNNTVVVIVIFLFDTPLVLIYPNRTPRFRFHTVTHQCRHRHDVTTDRRAAHAGTNRAVR